MRNIGLFVAGLALLGLTATPGIAQDNRVHVNVGGGPVFPLGDLGDIFGTGWGPAIGVTVDANERLGVQVEYAYRRFDVTDRVDALGGRLSANHQTHQIDFNLVANLTPRDAPARVYLTAGPGMYYRKVEITEYVGTGVVCDPFLYVCGVYGIEEVRGSRGGWDVGFNVGAGVGLRISDASEFFVETRYHYVWGPDIEPVATPFGTTASGGSTNATYWPLTFGIRF